MDSLCKASTQVTPRLTDLSARVMNVAIVSTTSVVDIISAPETLILPAHLHSASHQGCDVCAFHNSGTQVNFQFLLFVLLCDAGLVSPGSPDFLAATG